MRRKFRVCPVVSGAPVCDDLYVKASVLIVDDHPAFRASARSLLEGEGYEVVAETASGESAVELALELAPDVVLLDVALPDLSGLEVAERLADSPSKVVLVSSRDPRDFGARFRRTSAVGFIPKDNLSPETLKELLKGSP
jgi:DNA-binding NarL/FixJ family response regulator